MHPIDLAKNTSKYYNLPIELFFNLSGKIRSQMLRHFIYRFLYGIDCGVNSVIYNNCENRNAYRISIGDYSYIEKHCTLDPRGRSIIRNSFNFSTSIMVWTSQHQVNNSDFACESAEVVIEDYAWLSCRSVILPGVRLGRGAVVAAGAVVTKDVETYSIVGGVPAEKNW